MDLKTCSFNKVLKFSEDRVAMAVQIPCGSVCQKLILPDERTASLELGSIRGCVKYLQRKRQVGFRPVSRFPNTL